MTDPASLTRTRVTFDRDGTWPPEPTIITHVVAGELAERIRRRLGTDQNAEVTLTEETIYGGYSEWTQENSTTFTVAAGGREVTFHPDRSELDWVADVQHAYDSVFARFDAWLSVAERPEEIFAEWFAFEAESGRFVQYRSRPDTILSRTAGRRRCRSVHQLSLNGKGDGFGREWELDFVAAADANGFSQVLDRIPLCYESGLAISPTVARTILFELTDRLMFGRER